MCWRGKIRGEKDGTYGADYKSASKNLIIVLPCLKTLPISGYFLNESPNKFLGLWLVQARTVPVLWLHHQISSFLAKQMVLNLIVWVKTAPSYSY